MTAKRLLHALTVLLLVPAGAMRLGAQSTPGSDRVRIQVTVQSEEERKNLKGTHTDQISGHRILSIRLEGKTRHPETRAVRWQVYGKDLATNKLVSAGSGEFQLALDGSGSQSVKSERVTTVHTPDHILSHGKNRQAGKVAAAGVKYAGFSVEVRDGEKIVGLASDPPGIEKREMR
jgi:hypothetical protein